MDVANAQHELYWLPVMEKIECLHEDTVFAQGNFIKKMVLDRQKVSGRKIFRVGGAIETVVIVHLEIAESLLRRNCVGVLIKPVECI